MECQGTETYDVHSRTLRVCNNEIQIDARSPFVYYPRTRIPRPRFAVIRRNHIFERHRTTVNVYTRQFLAISRDPSNFRATGVRSLCIAHIIYISRFYAETICVCVDKARLCPVASANSSFLN